MHPLNMRKVILWVVAFVCCAVLLAAVLIPNLLRSRMAANEASRYGKLFGDSDSAHVTASLVSEAPAANVDRKIVRNAELELVVANVNAATERVRTVVQAVGGYIEKASLEEDTERQSMGAIVVRVPAARLDQSMAELKKLSLRVRRENVEDRDMTREYIDMDARLLQYACGRRAVPFDPEARFQYQGHARRHRQDPGRARPHRAASG